MAQHRKWPLICISLVLVCTVTAALSSQEAPPQASPPVLSSQQLDNLVAPIALYPDPLLGQILAASTYPLELIEAGQWLQQNRTLQGSALEDAARKQSWDASVQALVVFPDVIQRLTPTFAGLPIWETHFWRSRPT